MITVEIDEYSGFCPGVIRVIGKAEDCLASGQVLYSLGEIVHNDEELERLRSKGMVTVTAEDFAKTGDAGGKKLLVRAHGEPPELFSAALSKGFAVIDGTCPVVLKLQSDLRRAWERVSPAGGRIILFGKKGHPEVLGLAGQVNGDVCIVENVSQMESVLSELPEDAPLEVFSQTTRNPEEYAQVCDLLVRARGKVTVHSTICAQVSTRHRRLAEFAASHDAVVFVSGKSSSNGKVLCELCRRKNARTYHIGSAAEVDPKWFRDGDRVGVCGATSTPKWLLEQVASRLENLQ